MKFINKYKSANFNTRKKGHRIKFIILHYTAIKSDYEAIKHLIDKKNKVSSHFLVNKKGKIFSLVDSKKRAWHAGKSFWKGDMDINSSSIGIELDNTGHYLNFERYPKKQIDSLINLLNFLKNKFKIDDQNFLSHSDISPYRKNDPGEKFPWKKLLKCNLGFTPKALSQKEYETIKKNLNLKRNKTLKQSALYMLSNIGYDISLAKKNNSKYFFMLIRAYQMHHRQKLVNGKLDNETVKLIASHFNQTLTI
ncbi:MAG: N-acetylmuramoyl-L-alanine amidase [Alphaproteobacteria bacterium]